MFRRSRTGNRLLIDLFRTQVGRPLRSLNELGCGPGYHARAFALLCREWPGSERGDDPIRPPGGRKGRRGRRVERPPPPRFPAADCGRPRLLSVDPIDGLHSIDDFVRHFQAVAESLASDGIYVIGQSHQRNTSLIAYGPFHYEGQRNGCKVVLDWATDVRTHTCRKGPTLRSRFASRTMAPTSSSVTSRSNPSRASLPRRGCTPLGGPGAIRVVRGLPPRPALRRCARLDQLHHGIS